MFGYQHQLVRSRHILHEHRRPACRPEAPPAKVHSCRLVSPLHKNCSPRSITTKRALPVSQSFKISNQSSFRPYGIRVKEFYAGLPMKRSQSNRKNIFRKSKSFLNISTAWTTKAKPYVFARLPLRLFVKKWYWHFQYGKQIFARNKKPAPVLQHLGRQNQILGASCKHSLELFYHITEYISIYLCHMLTGRNEIGLRICFSEILKSFRYIRARSRTLIEKNCVVGAQGIPVGQIQR